ncbi:MAG: hypothetical protein V4665_03260 [Patescibacteria group bacterium]
MNKDVTFLWGTGIVLLLFGLATGIYFLLFFDTSVAVPQREFMGEIIGSGRVNNLGLMSDRQNGINLGFGAAFLGVILLCFHYYGAKKDPSSNS